MKDISSRQIIWFLITGLTVTLICSPAISKGLSEAVSAETRNRDLSVVFGAIEAGPLAIARLQSAAIAQEQMTLLMTNPQLTERGLLKAEIAGGSDFSYTFASWESPNAASSQCRKVHSKTFQFADALNPFRVSITRDECFVVAEQNLILRYSSLATILAVLVSLILCALAVWPAVVSIRNAEHAFADRFKKIGTINFRPIKLLVREGIRNAELEREQALTTLAQQVSHDIRSPLSALQMGLKTIPEIPEEKAAIIRNATNRINAIADRLIEGRREIDQVSTENPPLLTILESLIAEKRIEIAERHGLSLILDYQCTPNTVAPMDASDLSRILSNLINNSVDAIDGTGTITIGARSRRNGLDIIVSDSGRGIPAGMLPKLGEQSLTFGKINGSGMGLINARRLIEAAGGQLSIQSKQNIGTMVKLTFEQVHHHRARINEL